MPYRHPQKQDNLQEKFSPLDKLSCIIVGEHKLSYEFVRTQECQTEELFSTLSAEKKLDTVEIRCKVCDKTVWSLGRSLVSENTIKKLQQMIELTEQLSL